MKLFVLVCPFVAMIKPLPKDTWDWNALFGWQFAVSHEKNQNENSTQEHGSKKWVRGHGGKLFIALSLLLTLFLYITQDHISNDDTVHSGLGPSTWINSQ